MKKIVPTWILIFWSGTALATCPQIEGKYNYTCTVKKDRFAEFSKILDTTGKMRVEQKGCESYHFQNLETQGEQTLNLNDFTTSEHRSVTKIRKSNANVIHFRTLQHNDLSAWVTKARIHTRQHGFSLKGRENTRVLGFLIYHHAKFNCRFTIAQ